MNQANLSPTWTEALPARPRDALAAAGAYLVGGAVRDLLLGRQPGDIDLLADDPAAVAQAVAQAVGTRVVRLHEDPLTLRVPLADGKWLDLCAPVGTTLREDLQRRDFTVNAMAISLATGELVDPFGGLRDLRAGLVRATSPGTLDADPVRLLRAYRIAAELGFRLAAATRGGIAKRLGRIEEVAGERIGQEMLKWLGTERAAAPAARWAVDDGLLPRLIPQLADMKGVGRGGYHHLDVLGHTLEALQFADRLIAAPRLKFRQAADVIRKAADAPEERAVIRAAVLLHDVGKPAAYYVDEDGRMWFRGHEDIGATMAAELLRRWAWPRRVRERVERLVREHMRPLQLAGDVVDGPPTVTQRAWRRLARDVGEENLAALFVVATADVLAARGPAADAREREAMIALLDAVLADMARAPARPPRLVTGHDIMRELGLSQGPAVGHLLRAIEEAQRHGEISTREEALALARRVWAEMQAAGWVGEARRGNGTDEGD